METTQSIDKYLKSDELVNLLAKDIFTIEQCKTLAELHKHTTGEDFTKQKGRFNGPVIAKIVFGLRKRVGLAKVEKVIKANAKLVQSQEQARIDAIMQQTKEAQEKNDPEKLRLKLQAAIEERDAFFSLLEKVKEDNARLKEEIAELKKPTTKPRGIKLKAKK